MAGRVAEGAELIRIDPFAYEGALIRARADITETQGRLAELEARMRQEEAALSRAREQLTITQREIDRLTRLTEVGAVPERQLDDARLRLSQAESAVETRGNQLGPFWRAQQDSARGGPRPA